jgi:hypothetical protein
MVQQREHVSALRIGTLAALPQVFWQNPGGCCILTFLHRFAFLIFTFEKRGTC